MLYVFLTNDTLCTSSPTGICNNKQLHQCIINIKTLTENINKHCFLQG